MRVNYNKEDNQDFLNEPYQLEVKLSSPLYQMDDHTKMEWFHSSLTKDECNRVMGKGWHQRSISGQEF
ncbi:hypothetical protein Avbf_01745 [Armadillidium vulgare]|nr:hypothetical protein Avbf_01745 [Armadillidium vulgare]